MNLAKKIMSVVIALAMVMTMSTVLIVSSSAEGGLTLTGVIEEGDVTGVSFDLVELFPVLGEASSWADGVEIDFTYEIDGLVEVVEGYGVGCGGNASLFIKYGEEYKWKDKNSWSQDVNWMAEKDPAYNTAKLQFDTKGAAIMEAGFRLYNFQQAEGGDLDNVIMGKTITVNLLDVRVGGKSIGGGSVTPTPTPTHTDIDTDTDTPAPVGGKTYTRGDANTDEEINIIDVALVRAHIVKNNELTGDALKIADVNADGEINIIDVVMIRSHIVNGLELGTITIGGTTPVKDSETPVKDSETPAKDSETPAKDSETPVKDSDTPVAPINGTTTGIIANDGSYASVIFDLIQICPALSNASAWTTGTGVEIGFNYDVEGLVEVVEGYGEGCGANAGLFIKYGADYTWKDKNIWSYDRNWATDKALDCNKISLVANRATDPIQEAGLKIYNFQQAADGDLDAVVDGKNVTLEIKYIKINGVEQNINGGGVTPTPTPTPTPSGSSTVIYTGSATIASWNDEEVVCQATSVPGAAAGGKIVITATANGTNPQVQLAAKVGETWKWTTVIKSADIVGGTATVVLDADQASALANAQEIDFKGQEVTVTKIEYVG